VQNQPLKKKVGKVKCYPTLPTKTDKLFNLKQETGEIRNG